MESEYGATHHEFESHTLRLAKNKFKKIAVLYHGFCPDGFGGAYAAWKKFGKKAEYVPVSHQSLPPTGLENREVYIIDFSYPKNILKELEDKTKSLVVIDHHVSAKEAVKSVKNYIFDINHSGSVLAWKYFHPDSSVPKLLLYIEDTDLWKFKLPRSKEIMSVIARKNFDFSEWDNLAGELENKKTFQETAQKGEILLEGWNSIVKDFADMAEEVEFEGYKVMAVNAPSIFKSDVGNLLAEKRPPFAIIWYYQRGHFNFSLRSAGTADVSAIVKKYGGGGHKAAAGFKMNFDIPFPFKKV